MDGSIDGRVLSETCGYFKRGVVCVCVCLTILSFLGDPFVDGYSNEHIYTPTYTHQSATHTH